MFLKKIIVSGLVGSTLKLIFDLFTNMNGCVQTFKISQKRECEGKPPLGYIREHKRKCLEPKVGREEKKVIM
jgi:hypothetical protein